MKNLLCSFRNFSDQPRFVLKAGETPSGDSGKVDVKKREQDEKKVKESGLLKAFENAGSDKSAAFKQGGLDESVRDAAAKLQAGASRLDAVTDIGYRGTDTLHEQALGIGALETQKSDVVLAERGSEVDITELERANIASREQLASQASQEAEMRKLKDRRARQEERIAMAEAAGSSTAHQRFVEERSETAQAQGALAEKQYVPAQAHNPFLRTALLQTKLEWERGGKKAIDSKYDGALFKALVESVDPKKWEQFKKDYVAESKKGSLKTGAQIEAFQRKWAEENLNRSDIYIDIAALKQEMGAETSVELAGVDMKKALSGFGYEVAAVLYLNKPVPPARIAEIYGMADVNLRTVKSIVFDPNSNEFHLVPRDEDGDVDFSQNYFSVNNEKLEGYLAELRSEESGEHVG